MKVKRENKRIRLWAGILFWIVSWILMSMNWAEAQYIGSGRPLSRQETLDSLAAKPDTSVTNQLQAEQDSTQDTLDVMYGDIDNLEDAADSLNSNVGAKLDTSAVAAGDNVTVDWDGTDLTIAASGISGLDTSNVVGLIDDTSGVLRTFVQETVEDSLAEHKAAIDSINTNVSDNVSAIDALPTFAETGGLVGDSLAAADSMHNKKFRSVLADSTYSGSTVSLTAGENLTFAEAVYIKTDGKMWLADADAAATMRVRYMAVATIAADATGLFLRSGFIRCDGWGVQAPGSDVWAGLTPGAITVTQVSGTGDQSQWVGALTDSTTLDFDPDKTVLEME